MLFLFPAFVFHNNKYIHNNKFISVKYMKNILILNLIIKKLISKKYTKNILFFTVRMK